jgi:hypothetical protein
MSIEQSYKAEQKRDREWVKFVKAERKRLGVDK